ncbi:hypothetical protein [Rhabdaerophilum calidifontis]|uniref:hypothetical protein n=1 Tax=Rhabdaerophilum calidifontis TaxID=2604328 RepID=UPI00123C6907|nr:hypothetical protein [Rhabdaerophilum calidifontis]
MSMNEDARRDAALAAASAALSHPETPKIEGTQFGLPGPNALGDHQEGAHPSSSLAIASSATDPAAIDPSTVEFANQEPNAEEPLSEEQMPVQPMQAEPMQAEPMHAEPLSCPQTLDEPMDIDPILDPLEVEEVVGATDIDVLPASLQRFLAAAPGQPVALLDRYVEIFDLESWLIGALPFLDPRLVFAAQWTLDLLLIEQALKPAQSRDEFMARVMMLADSQADRPEHGHFELVCEAVLRADIGRLNLAVDDPAVTHFESRMIRKKSKESEG